MQNHNIFGSNWKSQESRFILENVRKKRKIMQNKRKFKGKKERKKLVCIGVIQCIRRVANEGKRIVTLILAFKVIFEYFSERCNAHRNEMDWTHANEFSIFIFTISKSIICWRIRRKNNIESRKWIGRDKEREKRRKRKFLISENGIFYDFLLLKWGCHHGEKRKKCTFKSEMDVWNSITKIIVKHFEFNFQHK